MGGHRMARGWIQWCLIRGLSHGCTFTTFAPRLLQACYCCWRVIAGNRVRAKMGITSQCVAAVCKAHAKVRSLPPTVSTHGKLSRVCRDNLHVKDTDAFSKRKTYSLSITPCGDSQARIVRCVLVKNKAVAR
ncbi:hypothetical protein F4861DRAFT_210596 [Xylaria intraflava]|nr:hypothetical protein F4861DRAFT_210596 [Xylaria intraflava]